MKLQLTIFALLAASAAVTASDGVFRPKSVPNPWDDDYSALSAMSHWRDWGTYNVHDPSCRLIGDTYYMYSTDAIYRENRHEAREAGLHIGNVQVRRSRDLVNWDFVGWAFDSIPEEGKRWVKGLNDGHGAGNVWAPYIVDCGNGLYHLYYCVSAFGRNTSYIGVAESHSPEGPWTEKGCVVRTDTSSPMNAIDPTVTDDAQGRRWMHYGSYFGGLYCVELDPATGLAKTPGDQGHLVARRANWRKDNLEAPEVIYNPELDTYYLFGSYDPLMTTYNVRVCRSRSAEGPFTDYRGLEMRDTTDNFPILTAPYRFEGHPGWVGTAHCSVFTDAAGNYYMAHQGRYGADPGMMTLHVRQMFFTPDGWPVVSPERYAGTTPRKFSAADLQGRWEIVRVAEPRAERRLEAGQILWGEGDLLDGEWNLSQPISLLPEGKTDKKELEWNFDADRQLLLLAGGEERIENLIIFAGHDWERGADTVLFTGLDPQGRSVWGKRVE